MNKEAPIGCRSQHYFRNVGGKRICFYCDEEYKEEFVPNGETWILSCQTFGYKIFHKEHGDRDPYCLYAGHELGEIMKLVNVNMGSMATNNALQTNSNITLKPEGIKLLEKLFYERKDKETDRAGSRL